MILLDSLRKNVCLFLMNSTEEDFFFHFEKKMDKEKTKIFFELVIE